MRRSALSILLFWMSTVAVIVFAQDGTELSEVVASPSENYILSIPADWTAEVDENIGEIILTGETLQINLLESVEDLVELTDDSTPESVLMAVYPQFLGIEIETEITLDEENENLAMVTVSDINMLIVIQLGTDTFALANVFSLTGEAFTPEQIALTLAILQSVEPSELMQAAACVIEGKDAQLRVGPGFNRGAIAFLGEGTYDVIGRTEANDGTVWFKLDKEVVAPTSPAAELWVLVDDVTTTGDCDSISEATAPPVIRGAAPAASSGGGTAQGAAPASGSTVPTSGTYTLSFSSEVSMNCENVAATVFSTASDTGLNTSPTTTQISVNSNGSGFSSNGGLFSRNSFGNYVGPGSLSDGTRGQLSLRPVSSTRMEGTIVVNFNLQAIPCVGTIGVVASQ